MKLDGMSRDGVTSSTTSNGGGGKSNGYTSSSNGSSPISREAAQKFASQLPVRLVEDELIKVLHENEVCIIIGETGSGKSTQIPQICHQAGLHRCPSTKKEGKIVISQPRRLAARSLAERVATEIGSKVGQEVGFKFRFENTSSDDTKILYATDGILLNDALKDPFLTEYQMVIVDEAHERAMHTDMLLIMLRLIHRKQSSRNSPLRIIIMSATLEAQKFSDFFGGVKIFAIEGRTFETQLFYLPRPALDDQHTVSMCVDCVLQLHESEPINDDFLVFLPSIDDITAAVSSTSDRAKTDGLKIVALPLYSSLSTSRQSQIYNKFKGIRKVIYSTNIAETSITIPGIRIVIDSGKVRQRDFDNTIRFDRLHTVVISKAQAMQRAGRAGREAPGKCYRLYDKAEYDKMDDMPTPEILRSNLSSLLLTFYKLGMRKTRTLKFIDQPSGNQISCAIKELEKNKLIVKEGNGYACTQEGDELVSFPIDPIHGRLLLRATANNCLDEAIIVLAFLSSDPVFTSDGFCVDDKTSDFRLKFNRNEGDLARYLSIYQYYKSLKKNPGVGKKDDLRLFGLNESRLSYVVKVRKQIHDLCSRMGLKFGSCGSDITPLRKSICEAFPSNMCLFDPEIKRYRLVIDRNVTCKVHPQSCLANSRATAICFTSLIESNDFYAKDVTLIDRDWVEHLKT